MNLRRACAPVLLAACLLSSPSGAAIIVFDPSNFVENSLTAARTLEEINNQLLQLQNEAQMLVNDALNLTKLPFNIVAQLRATLALTSQLIAQAQGIAYQLTRAQSQFARFYPSAYGGGVSGASMAA